ncbi:hypothetical protein Syn7502_01601 [Synechococcus sp. PCC 7502]|uniref:hypothetical protein n=1 Tax=Synechococcus sp. PCC 7502 TaxID=1173263 RepID=UPI00029F9A58|nr:hypothetical protein [Synechococcus sp. PCC 7502]AFY73661.1 hypothetical protein Syn7502_01601 [Synechococcus sp. PCC 7502]
MDNNLLFYRSISDILRLFVVREVEGRVNKGSVKVEELPLELRAIQRQLSDGSIQPIVEINNEINLTLQVKFNQAVQAGEALTLNKIDPEECLIVPPLYDGQPAAYFLCQTFLLDYYMFFDCRANQLGLSEEEIEELKKATLNYPILKYAENKEFIDIVNPHEKLQVLINSNWIPAPGYYRHAALYIHQNQNIDDHSFLEIVNQAYSDDFWRKRIAFWQETRFFEHRIQYIERAIKAHLEKDYICSIYVLAPQFEGIVKDYLRLCGKNPPNGYLDCVKQLRNVVLSRKVVCFSRTILDSIFDYLEDGSFWKKSWEIPDSTSSINRHGVVHGAFTGFESEVISIKYLILLDALSFVILHDRMLADASW